MQGSTSRSCWGWRLLPVHPLLCLGLAQGSAGRSHSRSFTYSWARNRLLLTQQPQRQGDGPLSPTTLSDQEPDSGSSWPGRTAAPAAHPARGLGWSRSSPLMPPQLMGSARCLCLAWLHSRAHTRGSAPGTMQSRLRGRGTGSWSFLPAHPSTQAPRDGGDPAAVAKPEL